VSPTVNGTLMTLGPALLVVGHPGHELMVHGWLESSRPLVMVLTDGSGHAGVSRLPSTAALVAHAGATPGSIFGRFTDVELYRTLLDRRTDVFADLVEELAHAICQHQIAVVAGDDAEGFNPTHDVCRLIIDAAVSTARGRGRSVLNSAFALMDAPSRSTRPAGASSSILTLNDAALERKLDAALRYPEMAAEVAAARGRWGDEAFRIETFRHVREGEVWTPGDAPPDYERYGRKRVEEGVYPEVICYDQHLRPLADLLSARSMREAS
jgi:AcrR family transcriptional regulator